MFQQPPQVRRAVSANGVIQPGMMPLGGINARDSLAGMPETDAIDLINVLTDHFGLSTRNGYQWWAWNLPGNTKVPSLMSYYPATASLSGVTRTTSLYNPPAVVPLAAIGVHGQLFAATNLAIYDVSGGGGGPWVPEVGVGPVTSDYWTARNFQNAGGNFLLACNDEGAYIVYGGAGFSTGFSSGFTIATTGWSRIAQGSEGGEIDGIDPEQFVFLMVWKRRLWFIEKDSTRAWYLPVEQITGVATMFDFGPHFRHGGKLVNLANWTLDGGEGIDDHLVAISTEGDVVVFKGYDPDSADVDPNAFQLHGIWYVGALPFGYRQVDPYGGDVYILSLLGVTTLSKLIQGGGGEGATGALVGDITAKIDPLVSAYMNASNRAPEWYVRFLPGKELFILGLPQIVVRSGVGQLVRKIRQGTWQRFADLPVATFQNHDALIFGGGDPVAEPSAGGKVYIMFEQMLDDVAPLEGLSTPRSIRCRVVPAYNNFDSPGNTKSFPMIRPTFLAIATPALTLSILTDYRASFFISKPALPDLLAALWNVDLWDVGLWGGTPLPIRKWIGTVGAGYSATVQLDYVAFGETRLASIDWWVKQGGPL